MAISYPWYTNIIIVNKKTNNKLCYGYSKLKGEYLIPSNNVTFENETNSFYKKKDNFFKTRYIDMFYYKYSKIRFKSKCFRIRRSRKRGFIKFLFGYAHLVWFFFKNIWFHKVGKHRYLLRHYSTNKLYKLCKHIIKIKPLNPYTNRGIRTASDIRVKKKGKVSTY